MRKTKEEFKEDLRKLKDFVNTNKSLSFIEICLKYETEFQADPPYLRIAKNYSKPFYKSVECRKQVYELKKVTFKQKQKLENLRLLKDSIWGAYDLDRISKSSHITKKEILLAIQNGEGLESLIDCELLEEIEETPRWWAYLELMNFANNSEEGVYEKVQECKLKRRINPETGVKEFWFSTKFITEGIE